MMFLTYIFGMLNVRIIGADPGRTLERISAQGIVLRDIRWEDPVTVCFCCSRKSRKSIAFLCRKQGEQHFRSLL